VTGDWRKLHNEEINDRYCSHSVVKGIKSRRMRWAGHVAHMGKEKCIKGFGGKSWEKKVAGSPRHRRETNMKTCVQEGGWCGRYWIDLAQERERTQVILNGVMKFWVLKNVENFSTSLESVSFQRRNMLQLVS
jgi:hypothetical protein